MSPHPERMSVAEIEAEQRAITQSLDRTLGRDADRPMLEAEMAQNERWHALDAERCHRVRVRDRDALTVPVLASAGAAMVGGVW